MLISNGLRFSYIFSVDSLVLSAFLVNVRFLKAA